MSHAVRNLILVTFKRENCVKNPQYFLFKSYRQRTACLEKILEELTVFNFN